MAAGYWGQEAAKQSAKSRLELLLEIFLFLNMTHPLWFVVCWIYNYVLYLYFTKHKYGSPPSHILTYYSMELYQIDQHKEPHDCPLKGKYIILKMFRQCKPEKCGVHPTDFRNPLISGVHLWAILSPCMFCIATLRSRNAADTPGRVVEKFKTKVCYEATSRALSISQNANQSISRQRPTYQIIAVYLN